ncbi:hypothetical protein DFH09DRAFT_1318068 [Mycena vulgaris]|nr:hypothetical protein DFH09DRAFT_1318068 [Mycena vulgaris]
MKTKAQTPRTKDEGLRRPGLRLAARPRPRTDVHHDDVTTTTTTTTKITPGPRRARSPLTGMREREIGGAEGTELLGSANPRRTPDGMAFAGLAARPRPPADATSTLAKTKTPRRPRYSPDGGGCARARALSSAARRWAGGRAMRESEIGGLSVYRVWERMDGRDGCIGRMIKMEGAGAGGRGGEGAACTEDERGDGIHGAGRNGVASSWTGCVPRSSELPRRWRRGFSSRGWDCGPVDVRHPECGEVHSPLLRLPSNADTVLVLMKRPWRLSLAGEWGDSAPACPLSLLADALAAGGSGVPPPGSLTIRVPVLIERPRPRSRACAVASLGFGRASDCGCVTISGRYSPLRAFTFEAGGVLRLVSASKQTFAARGM